MRMPRRAGFAPSRAMAGSIGTGVLGQLVLVASGVIVARALGPADRGVLALVFVVSALATQLGSLGVPLAATYWIAARGARPNRLLRELSAFRWVQLTAVLAVQAVAIVVVVLPRSPTGFAWVAYLSLAATAAALSQMYGLAVLQGLARFGRFNTLRLLQGTLYAAGAVALWALHRANLISVALVLVAAWVASALATQLVVLRTHTSSGEKQDVSPRHLISFGLRSLLGSSPPVETFRLDQLVVGLALSPVALGYFVVAIAFTNLTRFVGQSIGMVTYPGAAAARDPHARLAHLRRDFALGLALCGGASLALILLVPWLLPFFFGAQFRSATAAAQILLVAAFFSSLRRILVDGTRGAGRPAWGAAAESLTLLGVPVVVAVGLETNSLPAVAAVLAGANLVALLVLVPALLDADGALVARLGLRAGQFRHRLSDRGPLVAEAALLWLAAAGVGIGVVALHGRASELLLAGLAIVAVTATVASATSLRAATSLFVYGGVALLAMNAVRLAPAVTASDALFALAGLLLLPELTRGKGLTRTGRQLTGLGLIACGGLLGTIVATDARASILSLLKLAVPLYGLFLVMRLWGPSASEALVAAWLWVASATASASWAIVHSSENLGRPAGLAVHPNHLALTSVLALGVSLALLASRRRLERLAAGLATGVLLWGIVVSGSRAGLVGAAAVVVAAIWLLRRHVAAFAVFASGLAAVALVAASGDVFRGTNAVTRLLHPSSASVYQSDANRRELLGTTLHALERHPFTGVGFADALQAHDIWLQVVAGGGALAGLGFLLAVSSVFQPLARAAAAARAKAFPGDHAYLVPVGLALGFLGYLTAGLFQNPLWDRYIWFAPALLAAIEPQLAPARRRFPFVARVRPVAPAPARGYLTASESPEAAP